MSTASCSSVWTATRSGIQSRRIVCAASEGGRSLMADTVRGVEYYYVTVSDEPGEGQRILSALKDSGVNLVAFLGFPLGGGRSQLDLVPENPESLKEAAERAGVTLSEARRAFLIQGDDRVGAVAENTAKLAEANINLAAAAATGAGSGRYGMVLWVAAAASSPACPRDARRPATRSAISVLVSGETHVSRTGLDC